MRNKPKRQAFGTVLALAFGILACELAGACADNEACLMYACENAAHLEGSVSVNQSPRVVDVQFCSEQEGCRWGRIDLEGGTRCALWENMTQVCLTQAASPALEVKATWNSSLREPPPDGTTYSLHLRDSATGEVLVDVTREADFEITRVDNCHRCWGAQISL